MAAKVWILCICLMLRCLEGLRTMPSDAESYRRRESVHIVLQLDESANVSNLSVLFVLIFWVDEYTVQEEMLA